MYLKVVLSVKEKGIVRYFTLLGVKSISFNNEYLTIRLGHNVMAYKICDVMQFYSFIYKEKK